MQEKLTIETKYGTVNFMVTEETKQRVNAQRQKAEYESNIRFHTKNVALQSVVFSLLILAGLYYRKKEDPMLPFVILPSATASIKKWGNSQEKRKYYKKMLNDLERN